MNNNGNESMLSYIVIIIIILGVVGIIAYIVKDNDNSMDYLNSLTQAGTTISADSQSIITSNLTVKSYMRDKMTYKEVITLANVIMSANSNVGKNGEKILIRFNGENVDVEKIAEKLSENEKYKAYLANDIKSNSYENAAYYEDGAIKNIWINKIEN